MNNKGCVQAVSRKDSYMAHKNASFGLVVGAIREILCYSLLQGVQNWICFETSKKTGPGQERVKSGGRNMRFGRHLFQQGWDSRGEGRKRGHRR